MKKGLHKTHQCNNALPNFWK